MWPVLGAKSTLDCLRWIWILTGTVLNGSPRIDGHTAEVPTKDWEPSFLGWAFPPTFPCTQRHWTDEVTQAGSSSEATFRTETTHIAAGHQKKAMGSCTQV